VPQLEALLADHTSRVGSAESDDGTSTDSELSEVTPAGEARRKNLERERFWLTRETNLRTRWRRVSSWAASGAVWRGRRHAVSGKLAACRVRAIKNANVDRRLIDAFVDEVIGCAWALDTQDNEWTEPDLESRFDVPLSALQDVGLQLVELREAIRHERAMMVQHNRSLVAGIARRFAGQGMLLEDLVQEGTLGLLRAIDKFDPARGFQFSTYAIWWIRQGVSRALLEQGRSVRVPVHLKEQATRLRNVEARLAHRLGRSPTRAELGAEVGLSEAKVQHLQQQLLADVSLQRPLHGDGDTELGDNLVDEGALHPFVALDVEGLSEHLEAALSQLDARSRYVVTAHLGLNGQAPLTLDGISQQLGISRERVRQIERVALSRLRKSAHETHLAEYV